MPGGLEGGLGLTGVDNEANGAVEMTDLITPHVDQGVVPGFVPGVDHPVASDEESESESESRATSPKVSMTGSSSKSQEENREKVANVATSSSSSSSSSSESSSSEPREKITWNQILESIGDDINKIVYKGLAPIGVACGSGKLPYVKECIRRGADITKEFQYQKDSSSAPSTRTALYIALKSCESDINAHRGVVPDKIKIVKELLETNFDCLNAKCIKDLMEYEDKPYYKIIKKSLGETGVILASKAGNLDMVNRLITSGADVRMQNGEGYSALTFAVCGQNKELAKILIRSNIECINSYSINQLLGNLTEGPARYAVINEAIQELKQEDIALNMDAKSIKQIPLLLDAVNNNYTNVAKILIEKGANVNLGDDNNNTPLIVASARGNVEIARLLIENGATIDAANNSHTTPLIYASERGHVDVVRFLLASGAQVNYSHEDGATALIATLNRLNTLNPVPAYAVPNDVGEMLLYTDPTHAEVQKLHQVVNILLENGALNMSQLEEKSKSDFLAWLSFNIDQLKTFTTSAISLGIPTNNATIVPSYNEAGDIVSYHVYGYNEFKGYMGKSGNRDTNSFKNPMDRRMRYKSSLIEIKEFPSVVKELKDAILGREPKRLKRG